MGSQSQAKNKTKKYTDNSRQVTKGQGNLVGHTCSSYQDSYRTNQLSIGRHQLLLMLLLRCHSCHLSELVGWLVGRVRTYEENKEFLVDFYSMGAMLKE